MFLLALALLAASPEPPGAQPGPGLPPGAVRIGTTQFRHIGWRSRAFFTDGGKTLLVVGEGPLVVGEGPVVRFWDVESGKQLHEMTLKGVYNDAGFSHAANLLAVVGWQSPAGEAAPAEDILWLIDTAARKFVRTVRLPARRGGNGRQVRVSADGKRVVVEYEGDIQIIDAKSGDELLRHKGRGNAVALALSPDGETIAFGGYNVYLWRWETGEEPKKFASVGGAGTELIAFAPDGKSVCVADREGGQIARFEVATGRQMGAFASGNAPMNWSFSPDGRSLAVVYRKTLRSGPREYVVLWDPITGKEQARFLVGHATASHVSWSADGTRLAAMTDYRAWVWDAKTGKPIGPASTGHDGGITAFAFTPDGRLFTGSDDHTVRSWDATTGKPGLELIQDASVLGVAVSTDGSLVAGSATEDLRVWDAKSGVERFQLPGIGRLGTRLVQFTPDGKRLVTWGDDHYLRVWDMRNGKLLVENRTLPDGFTEADLDDDGRRVQLIGQLAALSGDGSTFAYSRGKIVQIFDVETGKERTRFEGDPNGIVSFALSADGKRLTIAGRGKVTQTRLPDGTTRVSTSREHEVAVWEIAIKQPVWRGTSEGSWTQIAYSHDGSRVGVTSNVKGKPSAIRVWDADTGKDLGRIDLPERVSYLAFDRTGKRVVVSQANTTATVYDLETALKPNDSKK